MIIRTEQMRALTECARDAFVHNMVRYLESEYPTEFARDGGRKRETERFVRKCIHQAKDYGIDGRDDVRTYIDLKASLGARFDQNASISEILEDPQVPGPHKMSLIEDALS